MLMSVFEHWDEKGVEGKGSCSGACKSKEMWFEPDALSSFVIERLRKKIEEKIKHHHKGAGWEYSGGGSFYQSGKSLLFLYSIKMNGVFGVSYTKKCSAVIIRKPKKDFLFVCPVCGSLGDFYYEKKGERRMLEKENDVSIAQDIQCSQCQGVYPNYFGKRKYFLNIS